MERMEIFKVKKKFVKFFIITGLILFLFGIIFLINSLMNGFQTQFPGGDWNYVIFSFQGLLSFFMGYSMLKYKKYFIEWDSENLRYFLPKSKLIETIKISDIKSIEIKLFEIKIQLPENDKTLDLGNIQFKELRRIKEKFEELKNNTDKIHTN